TGTANGAMAVSGSGTNRTVTISSITGNGTLGILIASGTASDTAGNTAAAAGPSATFTVDNTAPTISISSPSVSITGAGSVAYTVTYADTNFNSSTLATNNITLNVTGTASGVMAVSGSGTNRTVTISSITGNGTLGIFIASGTASDTAGNTAPAAGPSAVFTVDNAAPTISISSPSASITETGPVTYTVTYSDANFNSSTLATGNINLNATGTASGSVAVTGSGTTRTVTVSNITGEGSLGISITANTATDTAGNSAAGAGPSATFAVNVTPGFASHPVAKAVKLGTTVTFSVTTTGTEPITYQWRKDGNGLGGETNSTLSLTNVTRSSIGLYSIRITNAVGSAVSSNALLRVMIPQQMEMPSHLTNGTVRLMFRDADGAVATLPYATNYFQMRASPNLVDWETISGNVWLTNGFVLFEDIGTTNLPYRFYFVREQ
ncbi:MAG: hypothetical protein JWM68_4159, partial [Verrucomicrobiales bacterium]|nr:hypothetical protein [Verrucomicrobiales bacterium]